MSEDAYDDDDNLGQQIVWVVFVSLIIAAVALLVSSQRDTDVVAQSFCEEKAERRFIDPYFVTGAFNESEQELRCTVQRQHDTVTWVYHGVIDDGEFHEFP